MRRLLILLSVAAVLWSCGDKESPVSPGDTDDNGAPPVADPDSATSTVGSSGGSILLPDGSGVVFPAGAVASSVPVTVTRVNASDYFDSTASVQRVVLSTTASTSTFSGQVAIRVLLPATATPADSTRVRAGVIEDSTGAVAVERATIEIVNGKPYAVVRTNHFSKRLFEWFSGPTPPASAIVQVPYYGQGSSGYCWAASLHMATQAVSFADARLISDVIGRVGIDEGGISAVEFRMSSAIADLVKSRTGVRPDRNMWDSFNAYLVQDYLRRQIGVEGHPVAVFSSRWQHAVLVVGYDGSTFYVHDPASTSNGSIGYTAKPWSEFTAGMAMGDRVITLVVPKPVASGLGLITVNFLPQSLQFLRPGTGTGVPSALFRYGWDHTQASGYSFRHAADSTLADPMPGEVERLQVPGEIQIANASRTSAKEVSVWMDVTALGAPSGQGHISTKTTVQVGANASSLFVPPDIPVDSFRYNTSQPTEYLLSITALVNSTTVDRQTIRFRLASVTPALTSVIPTTAAVGETVTLKGSKLGSIALNNQVLFNGTPATNVLKWSATEIQVTVPEGATTGDVVVKRGEVASTGLAFTVSKDAVLTGTLTRTDTDVVPNATVAATSAWVLKGEGARLDPNGLQSGVTRSYLAAEGKSVSVDLNLSGAVAPSQVTYPNGSRTVYKLRWTFWATGLSDNSEFYSSFDGGRSFSFTLSRGQQVCANGRYDVFQDRFGSDGKALATNEPAYDGRNAAGICVQAPW